LERCMSVMKQRRRRELGLAYQGCGRGDEVGTRRTTTDA
jgi:hypothetical protein